MNRRLRDVHISCVERSGSKRTVMVWHTHVPSCVYHQYDPHTQSSARLDIKTTSNNSRKHKSHMTF